MNNELNGILDFSTKTGIIPHSKADIREDLIKICNQAFGSDINIQEGTELYSFLDILSTSLASVGGAVQNLYTSIGFGNASGTILDNAVALGGIVRKSEEPTRLTVRASGGVDRKDTQIPINTYLIDPEGNEYINNTNAFSLSNPIISELTGETTGYYGIGVFYASDSNPEPYNVTTKAGSTLISKTGSFDGITFTNPENSELGRPEENDAQLRYRYANALYSQSTGTVNGLQADLLKLPKVTYAKVIQNTTYGTDDTVHNPYGLPKHSVWVIVDGESTWRTQTDTITGGKFTFKGVEYTLVLDGSGNCTALNPGSISVSNDETIINETIIKLVKTNGNYTSAIENPTSTDPDDLEVAKIIFNKISIGCGTAVQKGEQPVGGQGKIEVIIEEDGVQNQILFSRASKTPVQITLEIAISGSVPEENTKLLDSLKTSIRDNIKNYIDSLGIGNDVLYGGVSSAVYQVHKDNSFDDFVFDINTLEMKLKTNGTAGKRVVINPNQYAAIANNDDITITFKRLS